MKFSVEELAAIAVALDRIASGAAEHYGIDNTWVKWSDPAKANGGNGNGVGKKMLSVMPVQKRSAHAGRSVNVNFHCTVAADTNDPRGILKDSRRDGQGIKYGVTVNMGTYQAMAAAMNLLSLAEKLTEIDRQYRIRCFRESAGFTNSSHTHGSIHVHKPAPSGQALFADKHCTMHLHSSNNSTFGRS
jgi:hypothetical protein